VKTKRAHEPTVGQLMTEPALAVEGSTRLRDLAHSMVRSEVHSALVVEQGRLRALLTEADLVRRGLACGLGPDDPVAQIAVPEPVAVGPNTSPGTALDLMLRINRADLPVVDAGRLVGTVSMGAITDVLTDVSGSGNAPIRADGPGRPDRRPPAVG
jgi:CBS domain-containing protein